MRIESLNKSRNGTVILNFVSVVLIEGVLFFTTPIFTRVLGTEQYGMYAVFNSWLSIISCFMGVKIEGSIATALYKFKDDYYAYRSSSLFLGLLFSVIIATVGLLLQDSIMVASGLKETLIPILFIMAICNFVIDFRKSAYIYEKKPVQNFLFSFFITFSSVGLSLYFISIVDESNRYIARIYGMFFTYAVASVVICIALVKRNNKIINKTYWKFAIAFGIPVVFHALSRIVLVQSDRIMMKALDIPNYEIGIYSVFYNFASVLTVLLSALNNAWCPFFYDELKTNDWEKINQKAKYYTEIFCVLTCGFLMLSREVGLVFAGSDYYSGIEIIPIIILSVYFTFMYHFPVNYEYFYSKTKTIAVGSVGAAVINIVLNFLLIPEYGMYGAAFATAVAYALLFVFHFVIVKRMKEVSFGMKNNILVVGLLFVVVSCVAFYIFKDVWVLRWTIGAAIGIYELYRIYKRKAFF